MNKFNFYNKQCTHSTNTSNHSARTHSNNQHQQLITPFAALQHSPSLSKKRLQNSPLHVPLAIAINKLVKKHNNNDIQHTTRNLFKQNFDSSNMNLLIQSPQLQNIKNILQQFSQSLYSTIQKQIYKKFNCEMKRMMLKYRQTQGLLNKINQKLVLNADVIQLQLKFKVKGQHYNKVINQLEQKIIKNQKQMQNLKKKYQHICKQYNKMQKQNNRLKEYNQKYQNTLISFMEHVQNQKIIQQNQRISFIESLQRQKQNYRNSMKECRKPIKSMMTNYQSQLNKIENSNSNSMSHSYIQNINKLEPSHSPVKKSKMPTHDISKRIKPEHHKYHYKLKITQKE